MKLELPLAKCCNNGWVDLTDFLNSGSAGGSAGSHLQPDDACWRSTLTIKRVIYSNNQFVAATSGSTFTSPDGVSWTAETNAPSNLKDIYYAKGGFVSLSANTYGVVSISGRPPLLLTASAPSNDDQIRIETSSGVGEVYALESSPDLKSWDTAMLMTNTLGHGSVAVPPLGTAGFFRMRSVSPLPLGR